MMSNLKIKTPRQRVDNAIAYISKLDHSLGNAIRSKSFNKLTIGFTISLNELLKEPVNNDKDTREALRALLLCQRYFLSRDGSPNIPLDTSWKRISIDYWKKKSKSEIDDAILMFTANCDNPATLADIAESAGGGPKYTGEYGIYYKLSRTDELNNIGSKICYSAIMVWLLKSELVSLPWYRSVYSASTIGELKSIFGTPQSIWNSTQVFAANTQLPLVPRGFIVHINDSNELRNGHWMVSLGNGYAVGCNNNQYAGGANNEYDNHVSINAQFYHSFNEGNETGAPKGVAYMFDPTQIPNRKMF